MRAAYVDTSCLVAIAFGEPGSGSVARRLESLDRVFAANLVEAELRATFTREGVAFDADFLTGVTWVLPDRPLHGEIGRVAAAGYVRGADLWHLAAALYLAGSPGDIAFMTLDARQREVAERLGFAT